MSLSQDSARYLRVASITLATYDYLITLRSEYRFYRHQEKLNKPSLACILFILNRYISIITIVVSNVGYFASFDDSACERFYLVSPSFKSFQAIVSQVVLGVRAFAISKRSTWVGRVLVVVFVICSALELFSNIYGRVPITSSGNCSSGNLPGKLVAWLHYLVSMIYDLLTLAISSYYLIGQGSHSWRFSGLWKILLFDGLGYFIILTATNIMNLIFYKTAPTTLQSAGASLGYAIIFIMTQRILINLQNFASENSRGHIPSKSKQANQDPRARTWIETTNREFAPDITRQGPERDVELAVQIHVNKTVDIDGNSAGSKTDSLFTPDNKNVSL